MSKALPLFCPKTGLNSASHVEVDGQRVNVRLWY